MVSAATDGSSGSPSSSASLAGVDDDRGRAGRGKAAGRRPPGGGLGQRPDRLEQHRRRVDRLGGDRGQPQPGDAPVVKVHRDRQLGLDPAQRHRVHREHVQPGGVQQQVLTRPRRPQPPVGRGRAAGDLPLGLRPAERGRAPADLAQQRARPGRPGTGTAPAPCSASRRAAISARIRSWVGLLASVCSASTCRAMSSQRGSAPASGSCRRRRRSIGQPGRAVLPEVRDPAAHRAIPRRPARRPWPASGPASGRPGAYSGRGSPGSGQLRASAPVAGQHLLHMRDALAQICQLGFAQPGQPAPVPPTRAARAPRPAGCTGRRAGARRRPAGRRQRAGQQDIGAVHLGDLPPLAVVEPAGSRPPAVPRRRSLTAVTSSTLPASSGRCRSVLSRCCHSSRSTAALAAGRGQDPSSLSSSAADGVARPGTRRRTAAGRSSGSIPGRR